MKTIPWTQVIPGQVVVVKGQEWKVLGHEAGTIRLTHAGLGEREAPTPKGDVQVVDVRTPEPRRGEEPSLFREPWKPTERSQRIVEKEKAEALRREKVAVDNGVRVEAVEAVGLKLILGASLIAVLKPKETPQVSEVKVMDEQTMRNHLHFFHDSYPELDEREDPEARMEYLLNVHEKAETTTEHHHSVPF